MAITLESPNPDMGPRRPGIRKRGPYLLPLAARELDSSAGTRCGQGWAQVPYSPGERGGLVSASVCSHVLIVLTYYFHLH